MTFLDSLGWDPFFENEYLRLQREGAVQDGFLPARVIAEERGFYRLGAEANPDFLAEISGKFRYATKNRLDFPAVGDWVLAKVMGGKAPAQIQHLFPRKTQLVRRAAGERDHPQVLATNVDYAFLVTSLNDDLNLRRLERYLTMVRDGGAQPVVILTKADLCVDVQAKGTEVASVCGDADVHAVSAFADEGFEIFDEYLKPGKTAVLLGSSGVGKSTLLNHLIGSEVTKTQAVREGDDKGRHTTTSRQLFKLPKGGLVIDTPGMRELQLLVDESAVEQTFPDVEALFLQCRFTNCRHGDEPGCAVTSALKSGKLEPARYESYLKLQRETALLAKKKTKVTAAEGHKVWKKIQSHTHGGKPKKR